MSYKGFLALMLVAAALPTVALADDSQALQLSAKAQVDGQQVPLDVLVSAQSGNVILSQTNTEGATPVTLTLYIAPKPQPSTQSPQLATTTQPVETSTGIERAIGGVSPGTEHVLQPVFSTLDSARSGAASTLDNQLASTRMRLAPNTPGQVLSAEAVKNPTKHPTNTIMYLLNTLYFYLLTLLRFLISSVAVFYPIFAAALLYVLWRGYRLVRRPAR